MGDLGRRGQDPASLGEDGKCISESWHSRGRPSQRAHLHSSLLVASPSPHFGSIVLKDGSELKRWADVKRNVGDPRTQRSPCLSDSLADTRIGGSEGGMWGEVPPGCRQ